MKRIIVLLLPLFAGSAYAQKLPAFGFEKVHITEADKIIQAEVIPVSSAPRIKPNCFYYWYSANAIHFTQGGYSGQLLNGVYTEYYLNKNLKEQGRFKKGLKDGSWKSWNEDGTVNKVFWWKNGIPVQGDPKSFWERFNPFKGKNNPPDTVRNTKSN
jgi:hypothetical protein